MSQWINIENKDGNMWIEDNELNVYVTNDDNGSIYAVIKIRDLMKLLKECKHGILKTQRCLPCEDKRGKKLTNHKDI